jgi:hypothetical protein
VVLNRSRVFLSRGYALTGKALGSENQSSGQLKDGLIPFLNPQSELRKSDILPPHFILSEEERIR